MNCAIAAIGSQNTPASMGMDTAGMVLTRLHTVNARNSPGKSLSSQTTSSIGGATVKTYKVWVYIEEHNPNTDTHTDIGEPIDIFTTSDVSAAESVLDRIVDRGEVTW